MQESMTMKNNKIRRIWKLADFSPQHTHKIHRNRLPWVWSVISELPVRRDVLQLKPWNQEGNSFHLPVTGDTRQERCLRISPTRLTQKPKHGGLALRVVIHSDQIRSLQLWVTHRSVCQHLHNACLTEALSKWSLARLLLSRLCSHSEERASCHFCHGTLSR